MAFSSPTILLAALGLVLSTITLLILNDVPAWRPTKIISSWVGLQPQSHPSIDSDRPSRSLVPKKDASMNEVPNKSASIIDYKDTLPPSIRHSLPLAVRYLPNAPGSHLSAQKVNQADFKQYMIPFTANYREWLPSAYTPTEVSLEEISALGDFPDYALLSGVPLPNPYQGFDITKAIARPYRPFRWAYHQTMGTHPRRVFGLPQS